MKKIKNALLLICLFLLAVLAVCAVNSIVLEQGRIYYQFIPSIAVGTAAVLLLHSAGMLREEMITGAPLYGLLGSVITVVLGFTSNYQIHAFLHPDTLGFSALFAQSPADTNLHNPAYAPFIGCAVTALIGAYLSLSVLVVIRAAKTGRITSLLRPNAGALVMASLPLVIGLLENVAQRQYNWYQTNWISMVQSDSCVLFFLALSVYLLIGILFGWLTVKCVTVPRVLSIILILLSLVFWYFVAWKAMWESSNLPYLSTLNLISRHTSGVFFGFVIGCSLRFLFAPKETVAE